MNEKREGHWSRPSSALAGGGARLLKKLVVRSMVRGRKMMQQERPGCPKIGCSLPGDLLAIYIR